MLISCYYQHYVTVGTMIIHTYFSAEPYWIQKPQSVVAAENDKVEFFCEAYGLPAPKNIWYLDGVPITSKLILSTKFVSTRGLNHLQSWTRFSIITAKKGDGMI